MNISVLSSAGAAQGPARARESGALPGAKSFGEILGDALDNVRQLEEKVNQNSVDLATANLDNLHTVAIDLTKAQLSVQMAVQVRNKLLDAYSELTRINL